MHVQIDPAVFNPVYLPYVSDMTRTQIFYGGSSSGKSVFLAQRAVYDLMQGGRNYLVCRQVARTVRGSVAQEIAKVIRAWGVSKIFDINKTDGTITCRNGYQIHFVGLDDAEKLKSITPAKGVFTDVWIEEATEADEPTIKQLAKRQRGGNERIKKRMVLSFNPIYQTHWIYGRYFSPIGWADSQREHRDDNLLIVKTTYKDNKFLTPDDIKDLENETDKYFYNVYTLGKWGTLGDVIFTNWEVQDLTDIMAQFTNLHAGGDFGYASDPAAVVLSHYDSMRGIIYIFGEIYETDLTNDKLADAVKELLGSEPVRFDSAEPKSIAELKSFGVYAMPAEKGKDSVLHGIQWLQRQRIIVDTKCINMRNELQTYQWKKDAGGNSLPKPVDRNNHLIDALRYAYEDAMQERWYVT